MDIRSASFFLVFVVFLLISFQCSQSAETSNFKNKNTNFASYVNPFMGTANHGHVYPGATVPFGAVQLSPDNGTQGWDWCSGYNWIDDTIVGFSHTHLSGTGIGDLCDISIMPSSKRTDLLTRINPKKRNYASSFSHDNEIASPGYYEVTLDNGINAKLTTTERVGYHKYTFSKNESTVVLDLAFAINWDQPTKCKIHVDTSINLITGYRHSTGWAKDQRIYFAIKPKQLIQEFDISDLSEVFSENQIESERLIAQIFFEPNAEVELKVGISTASEEGAISALDEIEGWDFEKVKNQAKDTWNNELSKISANFYNDSIKNIFYTSLYRTYLSPVIMSDASGEYKGVDGKIHKMNNGTRYDIFSLWDTFRAANPLLTLTQPERVEDFIRSILAHYVEYGKLPVWSLLGNETNTMTGYHAVPVIVDAYLKGFRDFDVELAYEAMLTSAAQNIRGTNLYREYGYIPYDLEGQSVTKTLEYAYDDWCIAQMAKALDKKEDYKKFTKRAESYKAMFDADTGFMRAKYSNGDWKTPFDPKYSDHNFEIAEYTEGNAWQHSWFVPHQVKSLIDLHGGDENFINRLDQLFTEDSELIGDNVSSDISGLIGQYAHGNEPSHHIAYLYNYAGQSHKSQEIVRRIMDSQYNAGPTGLCGNEDCGQMSAWYIFSALGMYPVNPASGIYVFGSPLIVDAEIKMPNGSSFTIKTEENSKKNIYIQEVILNGVKYEKSYITHNTIAAGGELIFKMGEEPNLSFGIIKENRPIEF